MLWLRKIRLDEYLKRFIAFCKEHYAGQLIAIAIYGSYAGGYFDKKKSDYDVFVIFKDETPKGREEIERKFPRISLQYFCTTHDLLRKVE